MTGDSDPCRFHLQNNDSSQVTIGDNRANRSVPTFTLPGQLQTGLQRLEGKWDYFEEIMITIINSFAFVFGRFCLWLRVRVLYTITYILQYHILLHYIFSINYNNYM